uniref:DUF834 domain-containing protein n=1 Tax=Oryza nivara TaxID=4536 RepID=A0A0E0IRK9_ORYNI
MIQRDLCSWRPPPPRRRRQPYPRANGRSDPPSCSQPGADTTITNMQLPERFLGNGGSVAVPSGGRGGAMPAVHGSGAAWRSEEDHGGSTVECGKEVHGDGAVGRVEEVHGGGG